MHNSTSREQAMAEQDDTVEIINLDPRDTVNKSKHIQGERPRPDWRHSPKRRFLLYPVSTICIVGLLTILYNLSVGFPSLITQQIQKAFVRPSSSSAAPSISKQDGIACLTDAAWSPDSAVIAVLGSVKRCLQDDTAPGLVNLYDANSRKLLTQFHPDDAVWQALNRLLPGPSAHRSAIPYAHVIWSPDGKQLACTFIAVKHTVLYGVVLMDREGGHAKVLLQQQKPSAPFSVRWESDDSSVAMAQNAPRGVQAVYDGGNHVKLSASSDGHQLASLSLSIRSPAPRANEVFLRWSPDGSHLLLSSDAWGPLTIWCLLHILKR